MLGFASHHHKMSHGQGFSLCRDPRFIMELPFKQCSLKKKQLIPEPRSRHCDYLIEASQWKCQALSHVQLLATPWTIAHQALLSMEFSRQEYQSGQPFPSPGDLPDQGIEPMSSALQADSLLSEPPGKNKACQRLQEISTSPRKFQCPLQLRKQVSLPITWTCCWKCVCRHFLYSCKNM